MSVSRPLPRRSVRVVTILGLLLMYVPLMTLIFGSFRTIPPEAPAWTLEWYRKVLANPAVLKALGVSLWVGAWTFVGASLLGLLGGLAIVRTRFPGRKVLKTVAHFPLVLPEIVQGLSLLVWFVLLRLTLGTFSIILAHITFSVSYVLLTVKSRLQHFDESLEEAARDLGATPFQAFRFVTLPLIAPAVLSGGLMAFTLSFDDFLLTFFTAGPGDETLPVRIYSMIKFGVSPEIHALSTLLLGATALLVGWVFRDPDSAS
jgi:spermidine/putrescine transport system permease protein